MIRPAFLLTAFLLAACSSDDDVGARAREGTVLCDDVRGYIVVKGVARRGSEMSDYHCGKQLALFALEVSGVAFAASDAPPVPVAPPLAADDLNEALAIAGEPLATFHVDEVRPGEVIPLGVTVTRDGLPEEGACVAWSESNPQIARGTFTTKAGHPWFEGRIEATSGAIIGRQSVDAWWPDSCDVNVTSISSSIIVTSDIESISTNTKAGD